MAVQFGAQFQTLALALLDQIDQVFVSSPAFSGVPGATATKKNPPFLLVVEGRFPAAELKPFLQGTSRRYRDVDLYRTSPPETTTLAVLAGIPGAAPESTTLLLGDEKSVLGAIDRRGRALLPASALLVRARALAAARDFWMIANVPLSELQPAGAAAGNPLASQIASQIRGLEMGVSLRDGLELELSVKAASAVMAAQMTQLLSAQLQAAMLGPGNDPGAAEIASKLHIASEGDSLRVQIALTKEELEQQLRAAQAARTLAGAPSSISPSSPPARGSPG